MKNPEYDPHKTVYLIDGTSLCYRAYYAMPGLTNTDGEPTGAVFGFFSTIRRLLREHEPRCFAVFFDAGKKTFRHDQYADYKVHRPETPSDLIVQIRTVKELLTALAIPIFEMKGFEADDLIATAVRFLKERRMTSVMVTSDKDMLQLVEDGKVVNYNPHTGEWCDEKGVHDKIGVFPRHVADYLALCGDSSDNVPGVRGIGPKTALGLIDEFGSVEVIYDRLESLSKASLRSRLEQHRQDAFVSKELVTLHDAAPLELDERAFTPGTPDEDTALAIFRRLGFRDIVRDFIVEKGAHSTAVARAWTAEDALTVHRSGDMIFFQHETGWYLRVGTEVCRTDTPEPLAELFMSAGVRKVAHNIKDALVVLHERGIEVVGELFDVMVAGFVLDSSLRDYSIESLLTRFMQRYEQPSEPAIAVTCVAELYASLKAALPVEGLESLFCDVEMPLIYVLSHMQEAPIRIDTGFLESLLEELRRRIVTAERAVYEESGEEFNLNSPKQLSHVLFDKLGLKPVKKTKTGFSTDEESLIRLAQEHRAVAHILHYRKLAKLASTYLEPFIRQAGENGGCIRPQFSQVAAQTGRLASFSPNLQNIPIRDEDGRAIRGGFVSMFEGGMILSADYSQIELRILAHISRDENLGLAFSGERDIHRFTAAMLFDKKEDDIDFRERDFAKRINFAVIYGMSAFTLARELNVSPQAARRFIEQYFSRYPGVKRYIDETGEQVEKQGYVSTLYGRKRYLSDIHSGNRNLREYALRQAVNAPIQGTAADIIKISMIKVDDRLRQENLRSRLTIQIHDELVFDVAPGELEAVKAVAIECMEGAVDLSVPLKVNVQWGKTWLEATK